MNKFTFNVENRWEKISIWIKPNKDIKAGEWFNFSVYRNQIKDKSLDDENIFNF